MVVDGQVASVALSLWHEKIYSGDTYYFGGKRRSQGIWTSKPYLQLLPLCLGDVIMFYLMLILWNNFSLSLNMKTLSGSR